MRELAFGARRTGRTTTLVMTMIEEMDMHNDQVYLIVSQTGLGYVMRDLVKHLNGDPKRIRIVTLDSMYTLQGLADPRNIYIEHTAYEQASSHQLQRLYDIEDMKDAYVWKERVK